MFHLVPLQNILIFHLLRQWNYWLLSATTNEQLLSAYHIWDIIQSALHLWEEHIFPSPLVSMTRDLYWRNTSGLASSSPSRPLLCLDQRRLIWLVQLDMHSGGPSLTQSQATCRECSLWTVLCRVAGPFPTPPVTGQITLLVPGQIVSNSGLQI